ncbi:MAG: sigma-70 family RNA polymerase sigma factor [Pseudobacteriovorax sp.]|nr:sigma-70 family RNA polymerase sigma factor [Pseudobacteriovorax sp.]
MQAQTLNERFFDYENMIYKVIRGFSFSQEDAEDIFQDVYMHSVNNVEALKDISCLGGWLKTITKNHCLNILRKNNKAVKTDEIEVYVKDHAKLDGSSVTFEESPYDPREVELSWEHMKCILATIRCRKNARVVDMFYMESKKTRVIAEELDMSQNTVLSHLRRFRMIMKESLKTLLDEGDL